jgi:hypothetical protein
MSAATKAGAIAINTAYSVKVRIDRFRPLSPNVCEIGKPELSTDLLEISRIAAVKQASDLWCTAADHPALGHIPRRATAVLIFNLGCAVPWTGSF